MAKIIETHVVNAPLEQVFASWNDFGNIYNFHPGLKHSRLINDSENGGLGAERQCNLKDGKNWLKERVVAFEHNRHIKIDIYKSSMPIKSSDASLDFKALDEQRTEVRFTIQFTPGLGVLGMMMIPMMKMQFRSMIKAMLKSNARYLEAGEQANPTVLHAA